MCTVVNKIVLVLHMKHKHDIFLRKAYKPRNTNTVGVVISYLRVVRHDCDIERALDSLGCVEA